MSRVCSIVLVCEGWRDSRFARSFLEAANIDARKIDVRQNRKGSGHDWVKTEFVEAVAEIQRFREGHGVLGLLDEDGQGVSQRRGDIARRLSELGLPALDAAAGRCLLLPTRNLETWVYWIEARRTGRDWAVNETDDYKMSRMPGVSEKETDLFCRSAGAYLHEMNHLDIPKNCPSMLADALRQLRGFLRML
jgi:hypothetical protein